MPDQLPFIASSMIGWGRIAGVHSTLWILASTAELMSLALAWSPVGQFGCSFARSQMDFAREQRVQHREADPPVVGEPALQAGLGIDRQQLRRFDFRLAALAATIRAAVAVSEP
jgi:hypothetical protein